MNRFNFFLLVSGTVVLSSFGIKNNFQDPCSILRKGTFKYLDINDTTAYFVVNKNKHTEYYANGKYHIISELTWKNDCEYSMKMLQCTLPDFPFKPNDIMFVKINEVKEDTVFYECNIKDLNWTGRLIKLK